MTVKLVPDEFYQLTTIESLQNVPNYNAIICMNSTPPKSELALLK